jgi:hypothetical protein
MYGEVVVENIPSFRCVSFGKVMDIFELESQKIKHTDQSRLGTIQPDGTSLLSVYSPG